MGTAQAVGGLHTGRPAAILFDGKEIFFPSGDGVLTPAGIEHQHGIRFVSVLLCGLKKWR